MIPMIVSSVVGLIVGMAIGMAISMRMESKYLREAKLHLDGARILQERAGVELVKLGEELEGAKRLRDEGEGFLNTAKKVHDDAMKLRSLLTGKE